MKKECVLYDRDCIDCGECEVCDLDSNKICDNCGKCIESGDDYNIVDVDLISENGEEPLNYHFDDEEEDTQDDFFEDQDFEEGFSEEFEDYADDDFDDEDDDGMEFDFGEFFGQR